MSNAITKYLLPLAIIYTTPVISEPTLSEIQAAALAHHRLSNLPFHEEIRRSKIKYLLPKVRVTLKRESGNDLSIDTSGITIDTDVDTDQTIGYSVSMVWNLPGLFYASETLRLLEAQHIALSKQQTILFTINEIYFERLAIKDRTTTDFQKATADLDTLCGGCMTHHKKK